MQLLRDGYGSKMVTPGQFGMAEYKSRRECEGDEQDQRDGC
jgi:hypothetical protein